MPSPIETKEARPRLLRSRAVKRKLFFWSAFVVFIPAGFLILKSSLREAFLQGCFLLAFSCSLWLQRVKLSVVLLVAAENEEAGVGYHAVSRAQPVSQRLPVPQQQFLHFDIPEGALFKAFEQFSYLNDGWQKESENRSGAYGGKGLFQAFPRRAHIKEKSIGVFDAEAVPGILHVYFDVVSEPGPFQIPAGELGEFFPGLVTDDTARGAAEPGESCSQGSGSAAASHMTLPGPAPSRMQI